MVTTLPSGSTPDMHTLFVLSARCEGRMYDADQGFEQMKMDGGCGPFRRQMTPEEPVQAFATFDAVWTFQYKSWMNDSLGVQWLWKVFLRHYGTERPQLLILDSHSSHKVLGLFEKAKEEDIYLNTLPLHTTHHLQPLDKATFGPPKKGLQCCVHRVLVRKSCTQ
ncbi:hypothetical protein ACOMHN_011639 [Nucella lapillus]